MLTRYFARFRHPLQGLWRAMHNDFSIRWQLLGGGFVVGCVGYAATPLTATEWGFLLFGW